MSQSRVYHIPLATNRALKQAPFSLKSVVSHRAYGLQTSFETKDIVGIKLPNAEFPKPPIIDKNLVAALVDTFKEKEYTPFLCDTTSIYRHKDANAINQINTINRAGLSSENIGAPFLLLDGINGTYESTIEIDNHHRKALLAGELQNIQALVILSTPGNPSALPMEGALFNMGEGLASKKGKILLHSVTPPQVNSDHCYFCKQCISVCPVQAIYKGEGQVLIDYKRCINCGKCVDITIFGGITYHWNSPLEHYTKEIVHNAKGVLAQLKKKIFYCTFIFKDQMDESFRSSCSNEGILISKDPVAIDQAAWDILQKDFPSETADISVLIDYASQMNMGNKDYKLVSINY
jgi:uncharacterized protein